MLDDMRVALLLVLLLASCGVDDVDPIVEPAGEPAASTAEKPMTEGCADVIDVEVVSSGDRTFTFHVTVSSADEGWDKYADEWVVRAPDGRVLGTRTLTHPHENEQPFTRSLSAVEIPAGLDTVMVAARDSVAGYCGNQFEIAIP